MTLIHDRSNTRQDYHYFRTDRSVTVQIGRSTNPGKYVWSVYHPDFNCAVWGDESDSRTDAEVAARRWVEENVRGGST